MISYTRKAIKLLRSRIQRLGAPSHVVDAMTLEMLVNLYKMSKRLAMAGALERYRERETGLLVERARGRVLDAGCGIGRLAYSLALANPELSVTGVDIDEEKIEIAREVAEGAGVRNLSFAVENLFEMKGDGRFDTIVVKGLLADLLEHSGAEAADRLVGILQARLAPKGALYIADVTAVRDHFAKAGRVGEAVEVRPVVSVRGGRSDTLHLIKLDA